MKQVIKSLSSNIWRYTKGRLDDLVTDNGILFRSNPVNNEIFKIHKVEGYSELSSSSLFGSILTLANLLDTDQYSARILPGLLSKTLESLYSHHQKSQIKSLFKFAVLYCCRSANISKTLKIIHLGSVDFSTIYDGLTGILNFLGMDTEADL